jgi:hypothetical protein
MLETLIVARAVLYGRSSQPFSVRRVEVKPSALANGLSAVRNVALKVSRWVGATS